MDILLAINGTSLGIGTMAIAPFVDAQAVNPFCNSFEANDSNHQPQYLDGTALLSDGVTKTPLSDGRVNDQSDHDPIRTPCDVNDTVCSNTTGQDLGVVLPVFLPDVAYISTEVYPTTSCSGSCSLVPVITGGALPTGYKCPNGNNPIASRCWVPVINTTDNDPRCVVADPGSRCFGTPSGLDGRLWNQPMYVFSSEVPAPYRFAGANFQVALDRNNRLLNGSFFRQHMQAPSSYNTRAPDANYTGVCTENDATSQTGCLVDADDCSMGYGGREAASTFPGGVLDANKALKVDGTSPFTVGAVTNLLASPGTTPLYELSRRLYLGTGPGGAGFASLPSGSGEQLLAQCFSKDSLVGPALSAHRYLPIPGTAGGVQCLDYDETKVGTQPLVNVQGRGNVALPGCFCSGSALCDSIANPADCPQEDCTLTTTNTDACLNVDNAHGFLFGF